ncbi:MAG: hypothetical protein AAFY88_21305 [Acidobacteriota bacterium]
MILSPHPESNSVRAVGRGRVLTRLLFAAALAVLTAGSSLASSFTVTLANGTSLQTRYRPVVADWDDTIALIRTDQGNWIALAKDEIVDVASQAEISGFGYQVDTSTLFLGWSPNDLLDEGDEDGEDGKAGGQGGADGDDARPYYENDALYDAPAASFGLEQFVDIPGEGGSIGSVDIGPAVNNPDGG